MRSWSVSTYCELVTDGPPKIPNAGYIGLLTFWVEKKFRLSRW